MKTDEQLDKIAFMAGLPGYPRGYKDGHADAMKTADELATALEEAGKNRQFGLCFCQTINGTYCVGQDQCKNVLKALAKYREGK